MRRLALTGLLIAAAALAAAPLAAAQDASPFRDYTSPAGDEYGHPPCNEQGNGQGAPNGNCKGHGNGNGNGKGDKVEVKGATASGGGRRAGGGRSASGSAPAAARSPVVVRAATAASAAARPSGRLPFTGRDLTLFVLLAVAALGTGALLAAAERVTRSPRRARRPIRP